MLWKPCDKWSPVPGPSYSQYNGSADHPMMIFLALNASLGWFYPEADRTFTYLIVDCYNWESLWKHDRQNNGYSKMFMSYS